MEKEPIQRAPIAAARLGAEVTLISKIGYDLFAVSFGDIPFWKNKYRVHLYGPKESSGVALISVDSYGENSIIVAPGASRSLSTEDIDKAKSKLRRLMENPVLPPKNQAILPP